MQTQEGRIALAIKALRTTSRLFVRGAAKVYDIPESTFCDRMKGRTLKTKKRNAQHNLTLTEEKTLVRYILDLDSQRFPPRLNNVRSITDLLRETRNAKPIGKQWPYTFVKRCPELKTRFLRVYDFQRTFYKDPDLINVWFYLIANIRTKYNIQDEDFYNFDETGFIMRIIYGNIVVTYVNRYNRSKQLQSNNRE